MEQTPERFDHWCIVEIFGHTRLAGRVSEATIGGCSEEDDEDGTRNLEF